MNWNALRPGQAGAIETIINRHKAGERRTAIVLPTRYGKSDVMRVATIELWRDGWTPAALALSPNVTLRDQLADPDKWKAAMTRYAIDQAVKIRNLKEAVVRPTANGEMFLSATVQLIERNMDVFAGDRGWVEHVKHTTGRAPLIFVDECHTGSEDNRWGALAEEFAALGCHIVLLTATHTRSDGKKIPGFQTRTVNEEPVTLTITKPGSEPRLVRVEIYEGVARTLELIPDYRTSFKQAWDEGALCTINWIPFDVELSKIEGTKSENGLMLSEVENRADARKALSRAVRSPVVMAQGVQRLVRQLRRRQSSRFDIAAIVFCGNDNEKDDPGVNKHARQIEDEIHRVDPSLKVIIATSADAGSDHLKAFSNGVGDVLIVKQMASLGLDIPRLKVGCDLSPIRTPAGLIQRLMRIATLYDHITVCDWISVDDLFFRAAWTKLIAGEGGDARGSEVELARWYEKEKEEREQIFFGIDDTALANFEDSDRYHADKSRWDVVEAILEIVPWALERTTHAKLAERVDSSGLQVAPAPAGGSRLVKDTGLEIDTLRADINELADEIVTMRMKRGEYDPEEYRQIRRQVFADAYQSAHIPRGWRLPDITNLADLKRIRAFLVAMRDALSQLV